MLGEEGVAVLGPRGSSGEPVTRAERTGASREKQQCRKRPREGLPRVLPTGDPGPLASLGPRPRGSFPTRLTPPQPATLLAGATLSPTLYQDCRVSPQTGLVPSLSFLSSPWRLFALTEGLLLSHPHPNPSSLQSQRSLPPPPIDTSRSKGPGTARNCDTKPQPVFPASLLPCLWEGAKLSPLAPGLSQAGRTPRVKTGRCWAFQ